MHDLGISMRPVLRRLLLSAGAFIILLALALFLPAGIRWWQGWLFLVIFVFQMALASVYLWHRNPEIFVARSRIHRGTKSWDKLIILFLMLSLAASRPG